jgi:hypothetical protein
MTYKSAKVYTGSEWVDLSVAVAEPFQRTIGNIVTTPYTILSTDAGKALVLNSSSSMSLVVPAESTYNFVIGQTFVIIQKGTGAITVSGASGVAIRSISSYVKTNGQYSEVRLIKIATNEWLLSGDLTS